MRVSRALSLLAVLVAPAGRIAAQPPAEWENPVRKQLAEGKPVVGLFTITTPSPDVAAQAANSRL